MGTTSKRCRSYWVSVRRKAGRFCAVNCPPDGQQSYISCCWLPVCRSVSAVGGARTTRQPAKTIRGDAGQPMWAREDVCELFAQNVRPFAENLGPRAVCGPEGLRSWAATSTRAKGPTELTTEPESPMMLQRRSVTTRSIDITSDSGLTSQDNDDARYIQEVLNELRGHVPGACRYYFGASPKPSVSFDPVGYKPSPSVFPLSLARVGLSLEAP